MDKHSVTVNIVYAGHPKIDLETGESDGISFVGHTWLVLTDDQGNSRNAGFAPKDEHGTLAYVEGMIYDDDDIRYGSRPPAFSRAIEKNPSHLVVL